MKENTKLIIAISLPIIIILVVAVSVIVPRLNFHPKYDFIYTVDSSCSTPYYYCNNYGYPWSSYKIVDGKITKNTELPKIPQAPAEKDAKITINYPKLYRYHVDTGAFNEISFEEVQKLNLVDGTAPDGTVVTNGNDNYGGMFGMMFGGGYSRNGLYLLQGRSSRKIIVQNGAQDNYYNSYNFHLVGWIN